MTKTDRILGYLPSTFRVQPGNSPLKTLVGTFGKELQDAENALAAVMRAHWVDHADRSAPIIDDLARLAALYGVAPRDGDDVEAFRARLKRYVRTFLEGTTTVQGLLRITADALDVTIADSHEDIDAWWDRDVTPLVTRHVSGADAAQTVLGVASATVRGEAATRARLVGTVVLPETVNLGTNHLLTLAVDADAPIVIDLRQGASDPTAVPAAYVRARINEEVGSDIATLEAGQLVLTSPTAGATSALAVQDGPADAAPLLLGLQPRVYRGSGAKAATYPSPLDLSAGVDLSDDRYIRLLVDAVHLAEIDVAGAIPEATKIDEVVTAINAAVGVSVASHDGVFITLQSPTSGAAGSLRFLAPAAQDATARLFGAPPTVVLGGDAAPGQVTGSADLSAGVDLTKVFNLDISIDGAPPVRVNCSGADPARSELPEIVVTINAALGAAVASHNGRSLILASPTDGPTSTIVIAEADAADASKELLGLASRQAAGRDATRARLEGNVDLSDGINLHARRYLKAAVDGGAAVLIDLRSHATDLANVSITELIQSIDARLGPGVASQQDSALVLTRPTSGPSSRVAVEAVKALATRRFVSRAALTDEAATAVLGFIAAEARGQPATPARIVGHKNLSRGVDLRTARFLRLSVDGGPPQDVDCAGPRPRATTLEEVVAAINAAFGDVATQDGKRLALASETTGEASSLAFSAPRATDAAPVLLGIESAIVRGRNPVRVSFTGTTNLSAGVDLSSADRLKLAFDRADPVEIACAGPDPANTTLAQIAIAINVALGINVASHDGRHLLLTSPSRGLVSSLEILVPDGPDATGPILGIVAPRRYTGEPATAAQLVGGVDLSGGTDIRVARFLRLRIDAGPVRDIDVAAEAEVPASASAVEIIAALNAALGVDAASEVGGKLVLTSPTTGLSSKLIVEATVAGDVRGLLFGPGVESTEGEPPIAASIEGSVDVHQGVELADRVQLRLRIDDDAPVNVDLMAPGGGLIFGEGLIQAIHEQSAAQASLSDTGALRIASPTAGVESRLSVLPLRYLEAIDYPPGEQGTVVRSAAHGQAFVTRLGAAYAYARITVRAPFGVAAPGVVSFRSSQQIRLLDVVNPGESVEIGLEADGAVGAWRVRPDGTRHSLSPDRVQLGPLAPYLTVPRDTFGWLAAGVEGRRMIVLDNPAAAELVVLFERTQQGQPARIAVETRRAKALPSVVDHDPLIVGWLHGTGDAWTLEDGDGTTVARLEAVDIESAAALMDQAVVVVGPVVVAGPPPVVRAERIVALFDVVISARWPNGTQEIERFAGVAIGHSDAVAGLSLERRILAGPEPSRLVKARTQAKADAFRVAAGRTEWRALACLASRFDYAHLDRARFAGLPCVEDGLFNVSRFATHPPGPISPVFAPGEPQTPTGFDADLELAWAAHRPGHVTINLPADLPPAFGARFNSGRIARSADSPETFDGVVTEPLDDPAFLVNRLNDATTGSALVSAERVDFVPIGFTPVVMPFSKPVALTGGTASRQAQLFLAEEGLVGFIRVYAKQAGIHGDAISLVACDSTPGRFDVMVSFAGARFENARQAVLGPPLTGVTHDLLKPGPIAVLQAKAAGVQIRVTRDGIPEDR